MARYEYDGPGPVEDPDGDGIVRPGDVREFEEEPGWGPWRLLAEPEPDPPPPPARTPEPPAAGPPATAAGPTLPALPKTGE